MDVSPIEENFRKRHGSEYAFGLPPRLLSLLEIHIEQHGGASNRNRLCSVIARLFEILPQDLRSDKKWLTSRLRDASLLPLCSGSRACAWSQRRLCWYVKMQLHLLPAYFVTSSA